MTEACSFFRLPYEVCFIILSHLGLRDFVSFGQASKACAALVDGCGLCEAYLKSHFPLAAKRWEIEDTRRLRENSRDTLFSNLKLRDNMSGRKLKSSMIDLEQFPRLDTQLLQTQRKPHICSTYSFGRLALYYTTSLMIHVFDIAAARALHARYSGPITLALPDDLRVGDVFVTRDHIYVLTHPSAEQSVLKYDMNGAMVMKLETMQKNKCIILVNAYHIVLVPRQAHEQLHVYKTDWQTGKPLHNLELQVERGDGSHWALDETYLYVLEWLGNRIHVLDLCSQVWQESNFLPEGDFEYALRMVNGRCYVVDPSRISLLYGDTHVSSMLERTKLGVLEGLNGLNLPFAHTFAESSWPCPNARNERTDQGTEAILYDIGGSIILTRHEVEEEFNDGLYGYLQSETPEYALEHCGRLDTFDWDDEDGVLHGVEFLRAQADDRFAVWVSDDKLIVLDLQ